MSDLISRSALIEEIKSLSIVLGGKQIFSDNAKDSVLRTIDEQPTAYDIGKVIGELKELKAYAVYEDINADTKWLDKAIEIVKAGVKNE